MRCPHCNIYGACTGAPGCPMRARQRGMLLAALLLTACGGDGGSSRPATPSGQGATWDIGPQFGGRNYSIGTPAHALATADGFAIDIGPSIEPHYVTRSGTVHGATSIRMRYRVDGNGRIYAKCCPGSSGFITIYFQRAGDDWNTDGWRWWATFATQELTPGEHEMVAPMNGAWTSVETITKANNPTSFSKAVENSSRVGFTLGGGDGYGHGVRATAPMRLTIEEFKVQ